ncbi:MAG: PAS domain-containing protein, partial [Gammaproteobacteria bacterium]
MDELPLEKVMDLLLDTVCVVDEQGRYVHVSASVRDLLGYEPEELIGRNMIDLVHPDDRERTLAAAGDIMAGR